MMVIIIYQPQLINSQVITDSLQSKNSSFSIGTIDNKSFSNNSLADYTLMIYMVGSDIEARSFSATDDILEIQKIGSNPKVNVLLETGGGSGSTTKSEKRFIDFTQVQRHVLKNYTFTMEDNLKKQNMGDPKTLSDFIVWGISKYPAKKYAIVFWDHGSGINGFGGDLQFKNDILRGAEINRAFSDAKIITNKKFELIGFDACLMSSIEIADKVKAHGRYMVSSQEKIPPFGWNYSAILESLNHNPQQNGDNLGKTITDSYFKDSQYFSDENKIVFETQVTSSVIDLTKIPQLLNDINKLSDYVIEQINNSDLSVSRKHILLTKAAAPTERYGLSEGGSIGLIQKGSSGLIDLYDFMSNMKEQIPETANLTEAIQSSLDKAVIYNIKGNSKPNAYGLSIYMPFLKQEFTESTQFSLDGWRKLIDLQYHLLRADTARPVFGSWRDGDFIKVAIPTVDEIFRVSTFSYLNTSKGPITILTDIDPSENINSHTLSYNWKNSQYLSLCNDENICIPANMWLEPNNEKKFVSTEIGLKSKRLIPEDEMLMFEMDEKGKFIPLGLRPVIPQEETTTVSKEIYSLLPTDKIYTSFTNIENNTSIKFGPINVTDKIQPRLESSSNISGLFISLSDYLDNRFHTRTYNLINLTDNNPKPSGLGNVSYLGYIPGVYKTYFGYVIPYYENNPILLEDLYYSYYENPMLPKDLYYTYVNPLYGLAIPFPANWKVRDYAIIDPWIVRLSPLSDKLSTQETILGELIITEDEAEPFERNTYFSPLSKSDDYYRLYPILNDKNSTYSEDFLFYNVSEITKTTIADSPAYKIVYTYSDSSMNTIKAMEYITLINDRTYTLEYSAESSSFSRYSPMVEAMIKSVLIETDPSRFPVGFYNNFQLGIQLKYPPKWEKYENERNQGNASYVYFNIPNGSEGKRSIDLRIGILYDNISMEEFLDKTKENRENFILLDSNMTIVSGNTGYQSLYIYSDEGMKNKELVIIIPKDGFAYIIRYTADPSDFAKILPVIQKTINSLKINDNLIIG